MAATILDDPNTTAADLAGDAMAELGDLFGVLPPEELELVKNRLRDRKKVKERSAYHRALVARLSGRKVELPHPHPSYRLVSGLHERYTKKAIEANYKTNQAALTEAKKSGLPAAVTNPEKEEIRPGSIFAPETDGEALMILQDPRKYQPLGPGNPTDKVDELLAEANRAKQQLADKDAELAALKTELEAAKKQQPVTNGRGAPEGQGGGNRQGK